MEIKQGKQNKGVKIMTRKQVMESQCVHNLTKEVLELSKDKDVVDRYYDVKLALKILKAEMDQALG